MGNIAFHMKTSLIRIIAVGFVLTLMVQMILAMQDRDPKSELAGWGVTSNPDGD